jgi:tRNA(Arg) A34 adenosine deaminase TadA
MSDSTDLIVYTREKDAIAFVGLMSYMYSNWDPPVTTGSGVNDLTHYHGLNICGLIVDNTDGEVLGIERNGIHQFDSPLEHGEQRVLRSAISRIHLKRPRQPTKTVEEYYREQMFYAPGNTPSDPIYAGCSLYSSLEPCPMCTATLCVCRMKRIVYCIPDNTYGGSWDWRGQSGHGGIKDRYYGSYALAYDCLDFSGNLRGIAQDAADYHRIITEKIGSDVSCAGTLRATGVYDTLFFDHLYPELRTIHEGFISLGPSDLVSTGEDRARNLRTIAGLKAACNIPFAVEKAPHL